jgi:hypothetical protein
LEGREGAEQGIGGSTSGKRPDLLERGVQGVYRVARVSVDAIGSLDSRKRVFLGAVET